MARLMIVVAAALAISGCQKVRTPDAEPVNKVGSSGVRVWTDPVTGCEYLVNSGSYGDSMQPRWNADGSMRCKIVEGGS